MTNAFKYLKLLVINLWYCLSERKKNWKSSLFLLTAGSSNPFCKRSPKSISECVHACVHNYRCAIPPKLSLEKGMGMTPGYNHRLRLRNTLVSDPASSWRQLKPPRSQAAYCQRTHRARGVCYFCPVAFFSLFIFSVVKKKKKPTVFVCRRSSVLMVRLQFSECPCEGALSLTWCLIPGCWWALRQKRKWYLELYRGAREGQEGLMCLEYIIKNDWHCCEWLSYILFTMY